MQVRTLGAFKYFDPLAYKENLLHSKINLIFSLIPRYTPPGKSNWNHLLPFCCLKINYCIIVGFNYPPVLPAGYPLVGPGMAPGPIYNPAVGPGMAAGPIYNSGVGPIYPAAPVQAGYPGGGFNGIYGPNYNPYYPPPPIVRPVVAENPAPATSASSSPASSSSPAAAVADGSTKPTLPAASAPEPEADQGQDEAKFKTRMTPKKFKVY